ncbi:hypothetical protein GGQ21_003087 [Salinibacter ruber]|nr:hypothetical protein [Salinibacter ruber]
MLSCPPQIVYVYEPFNVDYPNPLSKVTFDRWYRHVDLERNRNIRKGLRHVLALKYPFRERISNSSSLAEVKQHTSAALRYSWHRFRDRKVLWKDPIALLSAESLAETFGLDVLVMIRHPAAFAGSLKKKDWAFPFEDLHAQSALMEGLLSEYAQEIEQFASVEQDIVDQASLLWTILYDVVSGYKERHPEWTFVRHEDIARSPVSTFQTLYDTFGLEWTPSVESTIRSYSSPSASTDANNEEIRRDSQCVIFNWKDRLTEDEIQRVRERTAPVASTFYSESDWNPK